MQASVPAATSVLEPLARIVHLWLPEAEFVMTVQQTRRLFERFYGRDETLETPAVVGAQGQETDGWERIPEAQLRELAHEMEEIVQDEESRGRRISMAALQGLFIRSSARDAVRDVRTLFVARQPASE